ncbi:Crp/Fnr family transcriptional regulator [candidate division KSB1 bacterium]
MKSALPVNSIFSQAGNAVEEYIFNVGKIYNIKRDEVIFLEAEPSGHIYIILKGKVKISRLSREGKEVVIAILGEGNFFGEMGILDGFERSAIATAEENSSVLAVRDDAFISLLERFPSVSIAVLKEIAHRIRNSDSQIKGLSLLNSRGKVASAILRWAQDHGIREGETVVIEDVPTQKEMASYVGLTRETFNRVQKCLEREGFINLIPGGTIVINRFDEFKKLYGPLF